MKTTKDDADRLASQFAKSLSRWGGVPALINDEAAHLTKPVPELIQQAVTTQYPLKKGNYSSRQGEWKQIAHLSQTFMNAYLAQELDRVANRWGSFDYLLDTLESPIEVLMLLSLVICARDNQLGVRVIWTHTTLGASHQVELDLSLGTQALAIEIRPQFQQGKHRVDFKLTFCGVDTVWKQDAQPGSPQFETTRMDKSMIVECDGHDFHERTKEQAKRDKERDRNLQSLGFPVYRYTGSEIFADVFKASAEIVQVLAGRNFCEEFRQERAQPKRG